MLFDVCNSLYFEKKKGQNVFFTGMLDSVLKSFSNDLIAPTEKIVLLAQ